MTPLEPITVGLVACDPWQAGQMASPGTGELWEDLLRGSSAVHQESKEPPLHTHSL